VKKWLVLGLLTLTGCARPDMEFADGGGANFSDWRGHWVLINYWAEWCAPCRKEIPELNNLHNGSDGVIVIGVNFDGLTGDKLVALIETMGIEFPVLLTDPRQRWGQDQPSVLPTTLVINPKGGLEKVLVGPQTLESLTEAVGLTAEGDAAGD
jgi:thiol-disulfide isomerase/thioredoxin